MLVALTGATGFVGRHLLDRLLRREHEVRALVRRPERAGWLRDRGGVELVTGDLSDRAALRALLAGAGAVVHLVGIIVEAGRQTFERAHVGGTRNLVTAAMEAAVPRVVHMSALGARSDPTATAYHRSKAAAEEIVRASGLPHAIMRPSLIAGPGHPVLKMLVDMLRLSPIVPVIGDGLYLLQPVAVDDVTEAFALALEREDLRGTFDLAGQERLTYHQLLDLIEGALGVRRPRVSVPTSVARFAAYAGAALPDLAPITPDQLAMLLEGNTTDANAIEARFGIVPRPFAEVARQICEPYAPSAAVRP
ncbi:MAG: NAD(P)H-binding protein [Gemmatimonadetes bacterium]|nr:NAD(P)H-binding protein [Gemmatimonadota bacterium]